MGSRLYYEFTATVLGDGTAWERLADSVALEVRRHGAPAAAPTPTPLPPPPQVAPLSPAETAAHDVVAEVPRSVVLSPSALAAPPPLPRDMGAPLVPGSTTVYIDNSNRSNNSTKASNFGNSNSHSSIMFF